MTSPERPTQPNRTRILRSRDDRMLGGVCGGPAAAGLVGASRGSR